MCKILIEGDIERIFWVDLFDIMKYQKNIDENNDDKILIENEDNSAHGQHQNILHLIVYCDNQNLKLKELPKMIQQVEIALTQEEKHNS